MGAARPLLMFRWLNTYAHRGVAAGCGRERTRRVHKDVRCRRTLYTTGMRPVCFLSDFGLADDFVGTCKGVMLRIAPGLPIVDLTHGVPGFAVEAGAEILEHATRYMPADAVYLAVVDPGVGTGRRELALRAEGGALLVGPDNGLLVPAAECLGGVAEAVALTDERYHLRPISTTFHGRDVFAPVAAHLAAGADTSKLGEAVAPSSLVRLDLPGTLSNAGEGLVARIIAIDGFGNARLSLAQDESGLAYGDDLKVDVGDGRMSVRYMETFGSAKVGELVLVPDSHWRLSLAINKGNAAHALALRVGGEARLIPPQDLAGNPDV
jgi:S-adenosyl-L-methionine hydrolase (adenosine-forming)